MADRMVTEAVWGYHDFVLKSATVAERGKLAVIDTADGSITKGGAAATLLPLGIFMQSLTGDGVKKVQVQMFHPINARWWENDAAGTPAVAADVGKAAYIKDDQTVTRATTGSVLGLILEVSTQKGVLVYSSYPFAKAPAGAPLEEGGEV
jgi:hypothetical protein